MCTSRSTFSSSIFSPAFTSHLFTALPLDPEQACAMVQSKLVSSVQRLNMKPRHFFNAMHLSSKEKTLSREAMRNGLHRFTKYTITDPVLDHILEVSMLLLKSLQPFVLNCTCRNSAFLIFFC